MGKIFRRGIDFSGGGGGGSSSNPTATSVIFNNTDTGLAAANVQEAITEVNGKLESISDRLVKVADVFAAGTAGTYATNIELKNTDIYLILIRATNNNQSLAVSPIMYGYYNPNYITVVDGKVNIILGGAWAFADVYKIV